MGQTSGRTCCIVHWSSSSLMICFEVAQKSECTLTGVCLATVNLIKAHVYLPGPTQEVHKNCDMLWLCVLFDWLIVCLLACLFFLFVCVLVCLVGCYSSSISRRRIAVALSPGNYVVRKYPNRFSSSIMPLWYVHLHALSWLRTVLDALPDLLAPHTQTQKFKQCM